MTALRNVAERKTLPIHHKMLPTLQAVPVLAIPSDFFFSLITLLAQQHPDIDVSKRNQAMNTPNPNFLLENI